jgi:hypothetical protein
MGLGSQFGDKDGRKWRGRGVKDGGQSGEEEGRITHGGGGMRMGMGGQS